MNTKDFIKREWVMWILILIPTIFSIVNWDIFPGKIPTHWNFKGEVDDYGGKWAVFLGPIIGTVMYFLMIFLPKIDPRKKNYDLFSGTYWMMRVALVLLMSIIGMVTILFSMGYDLNVGLIVQLAVLGLFLLIGNQMGRIRPNYFVGIRTPWTINNEEVWTKTHRLGGRIWVGTCVALIIGLFIIPAKIFAILFFVAIILMAVAPILYSYFLFKKINSTTTTPR